MRYAKWFKIELIEALNLDRELNDDEFAVIRSFSRSLDREVRLAVAENLGIVHYAERNIPILKRLAGDPDELVRVSAVESLGERGDKSCLPLLKKRTRSRSMLVRGYACIAFALLSSRENEESEAALEYLDSILASEKEEWAKLNVLCALFILGRKDALSGLLAYLKSGDSRIRKASAACIELCIERDASSEGEIRSFIEANFEKGTEEYDRMMADII